MLGQINLISCYEKITRSVAKKRAASVAYLDYTAFYSCHWQNPWMQIGILESRWVNHQVDETLVGWLVSEGSKQLILYLKASCK